MEYYIYKIENLINHKVYIGLTNNIKRRRSRHFTDLRCNRHDNKFLQREFNLYGEDNFSFNVEFSKDMTYEEVSEKEREYIKKYDSYKNGYNQNEGGNFGPSNGGSHLLASDILNICAALEFCSRPGGVLSKMFEVSLTTISRIKKKENHLEEIEYYESLPYEERLKIYNIFCESSNFYIQKIHQTISKSKRLLTKEQVFMILLNEELKKFTKEEMARKVNVKSAYTLYSILKGISYKDYVYEYSLLSNDDKQKIVSLLSN